MGERVKLMNDQLQCHKIDLKKCEFTIISSQIMSNLTNIQQDLSLFVYVLGRDMPV